MNVKDCELKYSAAALRIMCREHGLQTTGTKKRLCQRLIFAKSKGTVRGVEGLSDRSLEELKNMEVKLWLEEQEKNEGGGYH